MGKKNKCVITTENVVAVKNPRSEENPNSWKSKNPSWCFKMVDRGFE